MMMAELAKRRVEAESLRLVAWAAGWPGAQLSRVLSKARYVREQRLLIRQDVARREAARRSGRTPGRIACVPDTPYPHSVLRRIASQLGLEIHRRPCAEDFLVLFWKDGDSTKRQPSADLLELAKRRFVANIDSRDISKSTVSRAYEGAFGYPLLVNPATYQGVVLEKPERNASHAGRSVRCPREPRRGYCYQLLIDNDIGDETVQDIRVPLIGSNVPFVYLKYRPVADRFSNANTRAELAAVGDVLRGDEPGRLMRVAELLGVDYGEMDCVRDRTSGKLYVVDVNTTPWGPPNHLPKTQVDRAIELLAEAFEAQLLDPSRRRLRRIQ